MDFKQTQEKFLAGEKSIEQAVLFFLEKIDETRRYNIYVQVYGDEAIAKAAELDKRIADEKPVGRLAGMILSIKDVLCYAGHPVTAGSKILQGFNSQFTGTAIQKLIDEDAIVIGTVNCDEFAMGSSNENSVYGPTKNGFDDERIPGGSSGASAVSVQLDTCHVALGTDTGGSVRQPAAFCGVIGMKPSYGRISRYGLIAYASSFDQLGLISKDLYALGLVLSIAAGQDPLDASSSTIEKERYHEYDLEPAKKCIAYFGECVDHPSLNKKNKEVFLNQLNKLRAQGHSVEKISFPLIDYLVPTYYILTTAEASSNLSRYDGVRYGYRADKAKDINELYRRTRDEGFGLEVKRRIMLGTFVLSAGYFDAYYTKAQQARRLIKEYMDDIWNDFDFVAMPCTTGKPWKIGEMDKDPVAVYLSDVFTVLANLCGIPAINLPYNSADEDEKYFGFQILAPYMKEKNLFSFINNSLFLA